MPKLWAKFWSAVALAWLAAAVLALLNRAQLMSTASGLAILTVLLTPIVLVVGLAAYTLAEGGIYLALFAAFKLVTLWRIPTSYTHPDVKFPWYGFARTPEGRLVASESAVFSIGAAAYVICITVYVLLQ